MSRPEDITAVPWTPARRALLSAGLAFLGLCILTPLIGPAGLRTEHARENLLIFAAANLLSLALAAFARRLCRREHLHPTAATLLLAANGLALLIALFGGFR